MTRSQATPESSQMITMARMIEERDAHIHSLQQAFDEMKTLAAQRLDALKIAEHQRDELLARVERCYKMLLSEPLANAALYQAENILREAIASVKEQENV